MAHVGFPAAFRIVSRKGCSVERQFEEVISNWISISPRLSRDVQCAGRYPAPGHVLKSPTVAVGGICRNASGKPRSLARISSGAKKHWASAVFPGILGG